MGTLLYNILMLGVVVVVLRKLARRPTLAGLAVAGGAVGAAGGFLALLVGLVSYRTMFGPMLLLAWGIFLHGPLLAVGGVVVGLRHRRRVLAAASAAVALGLGGVALEAFVFEPRDLEVRTVQVACPGLEAGLRVALVADIQTDHVGDHERRALEAVARARPDLVLFSGDYVQADARIDVAQEAAALADLLRETLPPAPLGAWAVEGDVDGEHWERGFEGTGIHVVQESTTVDLGPLALTLLTPADSRARRPPVRRQDKCHVVVGHAPDFALAAPPADLLLAGHTHGGQVQLPFVGPLLTLTRVPRAWSHGLTALPGGGHLYVSRGIGMERFEAPRVRFRCRPEVVLVDLVPEGELRAGGTLEGRLPGVRDARGAEGGATPPEP